MLAFEVYRADTWCAPLELDDEIVQRASDTFFPQRRGEDSEPYEAWYHNSGVLTMHMLNEVYSLNKPLLHRRLRPDVRTGEMAFVAARFPALIRLMKSEDMDNLASDRHLSDLRRVGGENEALAWFLILGMGFWKWGDDNSNDILVGEVAKLHKAGVAFDVAQPLVTAGLRDAGAILAKLRHGLDVEIARSLSVSAA